MKWVAIPAALAAMLASTAADACPDWQARPSFGRIELVEGFPNDPYSRNITAGGRYGLANCFGNASLRGSVAKKPDFDLYYTSTGASTLTIIVRSNYDTMLLVSDPDGNWLFDDDGGGGRDPMVRIPNAKGGLYDIWIGSFDGARGLPGTLYVTERQ